MRTLLVGAGGVLGRRLLPRLAARGLPIRVLSRGGARPPLADRVVIGDLLDAASLEVAVRDVDTIVHCAGASLDPARWGDRATFDTVDHLGTVALARAARAAGVRRVLYVSVVAAGAAERTRYVQAHRRAEAALADAGFDVRFVRATGFFASFAQLLPVARLGVLPRLGAGTARTNPIHEADLADACLRALESDCVLHEVGGPEVFTRRALLDAIAEAAGGARQLRVPAALALGAARAVRLAQPRVGDALAFLARVSVEDAVAPVAGRRRLGEYLRRMATGESLLTGEFATMRAE
ncbi:MAG: NAD(P)H-binding protein [Gemmatimonadales bacterium]|nr:NAD(P)H-binding protein [Gemmatimonadales bacterium]